MARGSHLSRGARKRHMAQIHTVQQCHCVLNAAVVALVPYEALDTHWIECRTSSHPVVGGSIEECVWSGSRGTNATVPHRMPIGGSQFNLLQGRIDFWWYAHAGSIMLHYDIPKVHATHAKMSRLLNNAIPGAMW